MGTNKTSLRTVYNLRSKTRYSEWKIGIIRRFSFCIKRFQYTDHITQYYRFFLAIPVHWIVISLENPVSLISVFICLWHNIAYRHTNNSIMWEQTNTKLWLITQMENNAEISYTLARNHALTHTHTHTQTQHL